MAFMVGTVKCQCYNIMGMPTDTGKCTVENCDTTKSFWGEKSYSRLVEWAKNHTEEVHGPATSSASSTQTAT